MKNQTDRRNFLKKVLTASGTLAAAPAAVAATDKVKMLTPDGKLVEVDAQIIERSQKSKVSNKELLKWSKQIKC